MMGGDFGSRAGAFLLAPVLIALVVLAVVFGASLAGLVWWATGFLGR